MRERPGFRSVAVAAGGVQNVLSCSSAGNPHYTAKPTRIYFIGTDGRVVQNPGIGPFGFNPDHLEPVIEKYISEG